MWLGCNVNYLPSKTFLSKWKSGQSGDKRVNKNLFCSYKLLETIRILCSHLFVVMKAENITEISSLMILPRWTKDTKITDRTPSNMCVNVGHYMTEEARIGFIYASS